MQSVVERLCAISGRGACTDAERRAALWLHDELRSRGHIAWVESRWVRPQRHATLALGCLLAVAGGLVSTVAATAGLAVAAAGAATLASHAAGWTPPLFPRRATQHVLTETPEAASVLVIAAAYDAPRRGLVLNERPRALLRHAPRWALAACAVLVAAAAGARVAGVEGAWLGALQLAPTVVLLAALAAAVDIALSDWAPGANDNASGVAVAIALFDELARQPPDGLTVSLLLVGAGHAVPRSVLAHLRAERLQGAVLEIGPCGAGHPVVRTRARAGVRLESVGARGVVPRAHQADDTHVDDAALAAALDRARAVVHTLEAEAAGGASRAARRPSATG